MVSAPLEMWAIAIVAGLGVPAVVVFWARFLAGKEGAPRGIRVFAYLVAAIAVANVGFSVVLVLKGMLAAVGVDATNKATSLAIGISEALNCYAFGLIVLGAFCVPLAGLTVWWRRGWGAGMTSRS